MLKKVGAGLLVVLLLMGCSRELVKNFLTSEKMLTKAEVYQLEESGKRSVCNDHLNYAPDAAYLSHTPMRQVLVNVHYMRNMQGGGTFTDEGGLAYANKLLGGVNYKLANNIPMALPKGNSTPALPMQFRLVLADDNTQASGKAVYFHQDEDRLTYFVKKGKHVNKYDRNIYDKYGANKGDVLNIFLLEHPPDSIASPTYKASADGIGYSQFMKVAGAYQYEHDSVFNADGSFSYVKTGLVINLLVHELGHTLGLPHAWGGDGCDDTPTHPNCWDGNGPPPCNDNTAVSNNMMDYNNCQCALTPCQLGKIHFNFSREGSTQRKLLARNWCQYKQDSTIVIGSFDDITWQSAKDLEGDIVINNGGKLRVQCTVSLPVGAKIIVKPKATLILDGATITNDCGDLWEGIEVWKNQKNRGTVAMLNGAQLLNAKNNLPSELN